MALDTRPDKPSLISVGFWNPHVERENQLPGERERERGRRRREEKREEKREISSSSSNIGGS